MRFKTSGQETWLREPYIGGNYGWSRLKTSMENGTQGYVYMTGTLYDVLAWWQWEGKHQFPNIYVLVKDLLFVLLLHQWKDSFQVV